MNPKLKGLGAALAATVLVALSSALSSGDARAGRPFGATIQKGVDAVDDIAEGAAKGARGADELGQGARGIDDGLQGAGQGLDNAAAASRPLPPRPVDDAPRYNDVPPLDDAAAAPPGYNIVRDEDLVADDLPDVPSGIAGYIPPQAPLVDDFAAASGDGVQLKPLGLNSGGAAPAKPSSPKNKLPKIEKTKVAKITPLKRADDVADEGIRRTPVRAFNGEDPELEASVLRRIAKQKAARTRKIVVGSVVAAILVGGTVTVVTLYYTAEPVQDAIDASIAETKETFERKPYTLKVTNQADGPVEIFKLDADANLISIGQINMSPGETTVDVKEGDVIVLKLSDVQWGERFKIVETPTAVVVQ